MAFVATRAIVRQAAVAARAMSTAPAQNAALNVDWATLRSKMLTDEGKVETDKARDAFTRRLSAATSVPSPADVDWASYKAALPDIDVDAIRRDYETVMKGIPAATYDEGADAASHASREAAWNGFARWCETRLSELNTLAAEQKEHALHRWYRRRRVWQRFPGLYEKLHHQVRGAWDQEIWGQYIAWKARTIALPWDATHGDITEEKRKEIVAEIASKSGLTPEQIAPEKK